MGLFGRSKKDRERKEARKALKHLEKSRLSSTSTKAMAASVDPSRAITELQPCVFLLHIPCQRALMAVTVQVNQERPRQGLSHFSHKDVWGRDISNPPPSLPVRPG